MTTTIYINFLLPKLTFEGYTVFHNNVPGHRPHAERVACIFPPIGGKKQRHGSALIGAGVTGCFAPGLKTPNDGSAA